MVAAQDTSSSFAHIFPGISFYLTPSRVTCELAAACTVCCNPKQRFNTVSTPKRYRIVNIVNVIKVDCNEGLCYARNPTEARNVTKMMETCCSRGRTLSAEGVGRAEAQRMHRRLFSVPKEFPSLHHLPLSLKRSLMFTKTFLSTVAAAALFAALLGRCYRAGVR